MNREAWLEKALVMLRPLFAEQGVKLSNKIRVSCGWPSTAARARKKRRIGECWYPEHATDNHVNIFISPSLEEPVRVLDILIHELVHAHLGGEIGHRGEFQTLARALGLLPPWTGTKASPELEGRLSGLAKKLGPYPHGALDLVDRKKKQSTRLLKVTCPTCGYVVRVTKKWLDAAGAPICPTDEIPLEPEDTEETKD